MAAKKKARKRFVDVIVTDPFTVQFTALSVILLAFFILLNSMASLDQERVRLALGSLIGTFGRMPGGEESAPAVGMLDNRSVETSQEDMDVISRHLAEMLEEDQLDGAVDVFLRDNDIVLSVRGSELFAEGSDELIEGAEAVIEGIVKIVALSELALRVEGHTDTQSTFHSRYGSHWMFAAARAARVHDLMLDLEIPPERLSVSSLGHTRPEYPNEWPAQRARNRRVEVIIEEGVTEVAFRPTTRAVNIDGFIIEVPTKDAGTEARGG